MKKGSKHNTKTKEKISKIMKDKWRKGEKR